MKIEDYIIVVNTIPKEICKEIIDDCNTRQWVKHKWNNYTTGKSTSAATKELDVMTSTKNQQDKLKPSIAKALDEYQRLCSWEGEMTGSTWLSSYSTIRFNKYKVGTLMRKHYDHIHSIFLYLYNEILNLRNLHLDLQQLILKEHLSFYHQKYCVYDRNVFSLKFLLYTY